MMTTVIPDNVL